MKSRREDNSGQPLEGTCFFFFFFFLKKQLLPMPLDRPRESVHHSSPLASHGLVMPLGLQGFFFQGRQGWGVDLPKTSKEKAKDVLRHHLRGLGGGGCHWCIHELFHSPGKRGKQSCVSTGDTIGF